MKAVDMIFQKTRDTDEDVRRVSVQALGRLVKSSKSLTFVVT
jgi:hypothetical protein